MKISITLEIPSDKADEVYAQVYNTIKNICDGGGTEKPPEVKPPKNEKPAEIDDEIDEEIEEIEDEINEEEPAEELLLEDVITTIKNFVGKNKKGERDKVLKTLQKKWGVKNVNKLDPNDYADVIAEFSK